MSLNSRRKMTMYKFFSKIFLEEGENDRGYYGNSKIFFTQYYYLKFKQIIY